MTILNDGTNTRNPARISGNRLFTHSVQESETQHAIERGDGYNINTGPIGLTNSTASGVFYLKNNEDRDLVITALAVGIDSAGTTDNVSTVTLIRNPTSVSFSTAVDMNQNRNFGSSKTLTVDAYKGAQGATVTGGNDVAIFYQGSGGRLFATIDFVLTKGDSLAVTLDSNTTAGTTNIYAAAICYLKETEFKELS